MKIRRPKNQRGFTLIEIMLAMMLLGTTGVSLMSAFSNASLATDAPENLAYGIASQHLATLNEAVRNDWWGANGRPLSMVNPAPQPAVETPNPPGTHTFTPAYTVNTVDSNGDGEDFRRVRITVTWP